MRESSIHIEPGESLGYFRHNDRSKPTRNSIFDLSRNVVSRTAEEAIKIFREEVKRRSKRYTERTGQKLNPRTATHLSAIVNLDHWHTMEDVQRVADLLEERFGVKVAQFAIHRDEGYIDQLTGEKHTNHHAHIEMVGIDEEGRSCRRKMTRAPLSQLQTEVAELLNMPRGHNYAKEGKRRPNRRDTYAYKAMKQAEEQERVKAAKARNAMKELGEKDKEAAREAFGMEIVTWEDHAEFLRRVVEQAQENRRLREELAKVADVKAEAAKLREELKEAHAQRPQYAAMEAEVKRLREQAKARELTIERMRDEIERLRAELLQTQEERDRFVAEIERLRDELGRAKDELAELRSLRYRERKEREAEIKAKRAEVKEKKQVIDRLRELHIKKAAIEEVIQRKKERYSVSDHFIEEEKAMIKRLSEQIEAETAKEKAQVLEIQKKAIEELADAKVKRFGGKAEDVAFVERDMIEALDHNIQRIIEREKREAKKEEQQREILRRLRAPSKPKKQAKRQERSGWMER